MKKLTYVAAICCLFLLFSCQEKPEITELVVEAKATTETAVPTTTESLTNTPTNTAVPTATESLTNTPTNTAVPTATESQTPSPTPTTEPTATSTDMPMPEPTETATAVPATATTAAPPPSPPPPAPAPSGANLLNDPSFEFGSASWEIGGSRIYNFYTAPDNPQFVHSGQLAAFNLNTNRVVFFQRISSNITPGTTYRAGVWVKIWSSSGENRTLSENPGDFGAQVCINTAGESDPNLETSFCTDIVRPLDSWQFISVDGTASTDRITILLVSGAYGPNTPTHNEAIWDDATLGLAPSSATPTPNPVTSQPVRPQPIEFNATALRDSMNSVRSSIEQAGGLLDRFNNGEPGQCPEYQDYYDDAILSVTYAGIPNDWAGIYNDYIFAVENFLDTNQSIDELCDAGGGYLNSFNYGTARMGINDSLNRLIPAIEQSE